MKWFRKQCSTPKTSIVCWAAYGRCFKSCWSTAARAITKWWLLRLAQSTLRSLSRCSRNFTSRSSSSTRTKKNWKSSSKFSRPKMESSRKVWLKSRVRGKNCKKRSSDQWKLTKKKFSSDCNLSLNWMVYTVCIGTSKLSMIVLFKIFSILRQSRISNVKSWRSRLTN